MRVTVLIASIFTIITSSAFAAPHMYGEIDASIDYLPEKNAHTKNKDVWKINTNSSFVGLKGEEKLTDRLDAVYLVEWAFNADGDGTDWSQRDRYVGLKDKYLGTLKVGKHNSPLKRLSSPVDSFNNYVRNTADVTGIMPGENRINNSVLYESPKFSVGQDANVEFMALLATGEGQGIKSSQGGVTVDGKGLGDAWSSSLTYTNPFLVAGIAYDKAIPSNFLGQGFLNASDKNIDVDGVLAATNTTRLITRIKATNDLALKALIQKSQIEQAKGNQEGAANIDDSVGWLIGTEYKIPNHEKWNVQAQYSTNKTSFKDQSADYTAQQIMTGVGYSFSKQVRSYGYTGYARFKQANLKDSQTLVGTGLEFKF